MSKKLGHAFVKIQYQDDDTSFSGCGFLVDPEHIVSCAHVLESAKGNDEALERGQKFKVDMPYLDLKDIAVELIKFIPEKVGNISFNEFDDLALLKITDSATYSPTEPPIKIPAAYKENGHNIQLYSRQKKDWITGQAKLNTEEGWLAISVDMQVEKGDSGSPIWNEQLQAITGMLVARQRSNLTCYMVSLWKVAAAFKGDVEIFSKAFDQPKITTSDADFLDLVVKSLNSDLAKAPLLQDKIIAEFDVPIDARENLNRFLVDLCTDKKMLDLIQGLQSALVECIDAMNELKTPDPSRGKVYKSASDILSKLVLFSIQPQWISQYLDDNSRVGSQVFHIPDMRLSTIEIITSRQFQTLPQLNSDTSSKMTDQIFGKSLKLESGIKTEDAVNNALRLLYCRVKKGIDEESVTYIDDKKLKDLRATIQQRQRHDNWKLKENYCLVIPIDESSPWVNREAQSKIAELIPELQWIILKSENKEEVLILDDVNLAVAINEFYATLETY